MDADNSNQVDHVCEEKEALRCWTPQVNLKTRRSEMRRRMTRHTAYGNQCKHYVSACMNENHLHLLMHDDSKSNDCIFTPLE